MLHLINFSFSGLGEAQRCLARINSEDVLLFIANGVFSIAGNSDVTRIIEANLDRVRVFVLSPDLEARGIPLDSLPTGIQTVDYAGFVELAVQHGPVHSWFK
ncbi:MAG: sulfurtransferase complex subunit TusB [Methylococcales bacterium]